MRAAAGAPRAPARLPYPEHRLLAWTVVLILIAVNAIYVAAEFAAVSVRHGQIQQRAEDGSALARRLMPYLADAHALDRYIAACQIGITLSSLILGAYGQATIGQQFAATLERLAGLEPITAQSTAALVVLVLLTVMQMVLGELVPKSLALQFPATLALYTVIPMQWSLRGLAWFIVVLNGSGTAILRAIGASADGHRHIHSPEEIELLIAESREGGLLTPAEQHRLSRALRLSMRPIRDVMTPRVSMDALDVDTEPDEALALLQESPHTRLPVYEETVDQIVGLVHTRDAALHVARDGRLPPLRTLMRPVLVVPDSLTTDQVLTRMREERRQTAVVLDEFGGTAGLVTVGDILEEVLGEVADEFKPAEAVPEWLPDGRVRLPGELRLEQAAQWIGTHLHGDARTVAGHVIETIGRIPDAGERMMVDGVLVEVERVEHHALESVIVTPVPARNGSASAEDGA